jgi:hypothetical protein
MAKIRTQIYLESRHIAALKKLARLRGVSVAETIRTALDDKLFPESRSGGQDSLWGLVGMFSTGGKNGSTRHDEGIHGR